MRIALSFVSAAFAAVMLTSCKETAAEPKADVAATESAAPSGEMQTASFKIDGMTCSMGCAKTIEKKLAALDGVRQAKVDFENKTATVEYDAALQTPEKLVETVEAVADGKTYKVSDVKNSGDQAMVVLKEKDKEKKKKKKEAKTADKKEGCSTEAKPAGCCAAKKAAGCSEKATM